MNDSQKIQWSDKITVNLRESEQHERTKEAVKEGWWIKGFWVSRLALTFLVVIVFAISMWFIYTTRVIQMEGWYCLLGVNSAFIVLIAFRISKLKETLVGNEFYNGLVQNLSFIIISIALTDIFFETYFIARIFSIPDIFSVLCVNISLVLIVVMGDSIALMKYGQRDDNYWKRFPIFIFIACGIFLFFVIGARLSITAYIDANVFTAGMIGLSDLLYQAMFPPLFSGQYGGAQSFLQIWEALFYNSYAGAMLCLMVIGTFANIFFINQDRAPAIQSASTMTVVGLPLIMVIMMFLGAIPPSSVLVKLFGAPQLASFVYAIAMISVYTIFLCIMMVFSQAAEVFNPQDPK